MILRTTCVNPALAAAVTLSACSLRPAAPTAHGVIDAFTAAGAPVMNVQAPERDTDAPLAYTYKEHLTFTIPALGDKGRQLFVCGTKQACDDLYTYFDDLKAVADPYLYRSPDGRVIVHLDRGVTGEQAAAFEQVIKSLP